LLSCLFGLGVSAQQTASIAYEHDSLGRLIGAGYDTGATIDYSYDVNGNRLQVVSSVVGGSVQTPYGGTPASVDGTTGLVDFPARNWDEGGLGVAFNETTPGHDGGQAFWWSADGIESYTPSNGPSSVMSYAANGEWLEYTINVAQAGDYGVTLLAAGSAARQVDIGFDKTGGQVCSPYQSATITYPSTGGWSAFVTTPSVTVTLDAGLQVFRIGDYQGDTDTASFSIIPTGSQGGGGL